ncbi:RteC domain-containing protein [Mucilaginibacter daejeonensis]|uniref:RteC domain-containing protein n=1 Tax=Mucilaginibacter daejeonensis TaxID=398049 RepID=UPI001D171B2D|nr:RteC domain-containing protein [Mucilaginibacter daejeonensis]UEG54899.1 RteC domain-containing protein [Mucilaginibacter daejeonensis]
MAKLKNYISSYVFQDTDEEIEFFKVVKPRFYSKYIYFISVYNFLMKRPTGAEDHLKEYIYSELADLKRYFDHNAAFYQYYRSGSTLMDRVYFTRGGFDVHVELEKFEEDEIYSTSHDYKLSNIIANERYQEFLNTELIRINNPDEARTEQDMELPLTWTFNKTDLIELIYALVAAGVFNNGNVEIRSVVNCFQMVFHIELGAYYHKYTDITRRKKDRTAFLDKLKISLLRRIDEKFDHDAHGQSSMNF